jgi:hypothetical protein
VLSWFGYLTKIIAATEDEGGKLACFSTGQLSEITF